MSNTQLKPSYRASGDAYNDLMLATVFSRANLGTDAPQVWVEVHLANGLPAVHIVGLAESAVRESRDRVRSALTTLGFDFPAGHVTINLAPADLPKEGGRFDLPIALGILAASKQIPSELLTNCEFYGELSLGGMVKGVRGVLPSVCAATGAGRTVVVPEENFTEARLVQGARITGVAHLRMVCDQLRNDQLFEFEQCAGEAAPGGFGRPHADMADVHDQTLARRALEIAAAGSHSILLMGPPGTGKSLLANRLPGILPPMTLGESMETAAIASLSARGFRVSEWGRRPFRAPHHTVPAVALAGGGAHPRPGEISLAHNGVLFLDELPEFSREALEVLREPLETGSISVSRIAHQVDFPARFQLIAAMNLCPCGYFGDGTDRCRCQPQRIHAYRARISGPLLERLDMHVPVMRVSAKSLLGRAERAESSARIAERVRSARQLQLDRQEVCNAQLDQERLECHCSLTADGTSTLEASVTRYDLSARTFHRILRVARTIADLEGTQDINGSHVTEAIMFRPRDRAELFDPTARDHDFHSG